MTLSPLAARFLSALVLAPPCVYALIAGAPYSLILGLVISLGLLGEWVRLLRGIQFSFTLKLCLGVGGTAYLGVALAWILNQLSQPAGCRLIMGLLFLVWAIDTSAFFGGKFFKGPKLAPSISPHKTWSGFISGMIAGLSLGSLLIGSFFPSTFTLSGVALLSLMAQGGDLLESQVKRWSHVKDSSSLIPGHGGLLDRLDSFLALAVALALWSLFSLR